MPKPYFARCSAIAIVSLVTLLGACAIDGEEPRLSQSERALDFDWDPFDPYPDFPLPDPLIFQPSCQVSCGGMGSPHHWSVGPCSCAPGCEVDGTCCDDYAAECPTSDYSCTGRCGGSAPSGCYCDDACTGYGDCCWDEALACDAPQSTLGNGEYVWIHAVASTGGGAVVAGTYEGDVVLPSGDVLLATPGDISQDVFVAEYSSSGELMWSYTINGTMQQWAKDIAVDGQGFVYVSGAFWGTTTFGGKVSRTSAGNTDGFVLCLSPGGSFEWVRTFGGAGYDGASQVVAGDRGWAYVGAYVSPGANLGKGTISSYGNYVAAYDRAAGAHQWSRRMPLSSPPSLALDVPGNVVVAGSFKGTIDLGNGPVVSAGDNDVVVARYSPDGALLPNQFSVGGPGRDEVVGLDVDGWGGVVLAGSFNDQITIGASTFAAGGANEIFIAAFRPSGAARWARRLAGTRHYPSNEESGQGLSVDDGGNAWFSDSHWQAVNLGGGWLTPTDGDSFVVSYTPDGDVRFQRRLRGSSSQIVRDMATDSYGRGWLGGYFYDVLVSDEGTLSSGGISDAFLLRVLP